MLKLSSADAKQLRQTSCAKDDNMMGDVEKQIFDMICKQHLVNRKELVSRFKATGGLETGLSKLIDMGLISKVESLGTCYVVTQKGIRTFENDGI
jgi:predicted transcriptional regulator